MIVRIVADYAEGYDNGSGNGWGDGYDLSGNGWGTGSCGRVYCGDGDGDGDNESESPPEEGALCLLT